MSTYPVYKVGDRIQWISDRMLGTLVSVEEEAVKIQFDGWALTGPFTYHNSADNYSLIRPYVDNPYDLDPIS